MSDPANAIAKIVMKIDGEVQNFETEAGETILEAALRVGIDAPYGCMAGTCNACQAHVTKGKVEMEYCDALSDDEIADGEILTCQAKATSPDVEVEFTI